VPVSRFFNVLFDFDHPLADGGQVHFLFGDRGADVARLFPAVLLSATIPEQ
jgi:hypothetical protein